MNYNSEITIEFLLQLLVRSETLNLEFKQEFYKLDDDNQNVARASKHELVRDILALANGNALTAGETAFLIIGASNNRNSSGKRELFDIDPALIDEKRILDIVNSFCEPSLAVLHSSIVEIDGKRLAVIIIPPSIHLHETTTELITKDENGKSKVYREYTVFVRHSDKVEIASAKERATILELKRIRESEVNLLLFGAGIGSIIGGFSLAPMGEKLSGKKEGLIGGAIAGSLLGGVLGGAMGGAYRDLQDIRANWHKTPTSGKVLAIGSGMLTTISFWTMANFLSKKFKKDKTVPDQNGG